jgi:tripartite-type tricarboxylate transporter receptor subunit TctC
MKLPRRNFLHLAAGAAALPAVSRVTWAPAYPVRPIALVVPIGAGCAVDTAARIICRKAAGEVAAIGRGPGVRGSA